LRGRGRGGTWGTRCLIWVGMFVIETFPPRWPHLPPSPALPLSHCGTLWYHVVPWWSHCGVMWWDWAYELKVVVGGGVAVKAAVVVGGRGRSSGGGKSTYGPTCWKADVSSASVTRRSQRTLKSMLYKLGASRISHLAFRMGLYNVDLRVRCDFLWWMCLTTSHSLVLKPLPRTLI